MQLAAFRDELNHTIQRQRLTEIPKRMKGKGQSDERMPKWPQRMQGP
jgi:hypothetical protein